MEGAFKATTMNSDDSEDPVKVAAGNNTCEICCKHSPNKLNNCIRGCGKTFCNECLGDLDITFVINPSGERKESTVYYCKLCKHD